MKNVGTFLVPNQSALIRWGNAAQRHNCDSHSRFKLFFLHSESRLSGDSTGATRTRNARDPDTGGNAGQPYHQRRCDFCTRRHQADSLGADQILIQGHADRQVRQSDLANQDSLKRRRQAGSAPSARSAEASMSIDAAH